ncbi:hypothetical protein H6G11_16470 [Cyanobacterium aponinum FACHB-4101]|uniref:hypothetical protein n=1 Tax=Cyanobacterium aponinum TaxID=379064 RepID=UPI0016808776|nr:hypothetical protein [Cyanobacterium aponinum]MBD2395840.1 hypothetical protein [Cyanobacterium aponinum FACHB-4101]
MKCLISPYESLYSEPEIGGIEPDQRFAEIYELVWSYAEKDESLDWQELTRKFIFNQHSYIINGCILWEIKLKKLYRRGEKKYKSFQDYCEQELKMCVWQGNRLINAARVAITLIHNGFSIIPTCEFQCRELSKYNDAQIIDYWQEILAQFEGREYEMTGQKIWGIIRQIRIEAGEEVKPPKWKKIKILRSLYEKICEQAREHWMTFVEYLEHTFCDDEPPPDREPEPDDYIPTPEDWQALEELEASFINSS